MLRIGNHTVEMNVQHHMNRRSFLASLTVAPIIAALAACGDPNQPAAATQPTSVTTTPGTDPPTTAASGIAHPTGADDLLLTIGYEGGLVAVGYDFANVPSLLLSGDGRVFQPAPVPAIYPGPLLPSVSVRTITEAGIQAVLSVADHAGLLAPPPEYPDRHNVADAASTVLTINAAGGAFVHSAYALGMGEPESGARKTLLDAVTRISDIEASAGISNLGAAEQFVATTYRLQSRPIDVNELANQEPPPPTIVDWPATAGVSLAVAGTCARVGAAAVGSLFADAKQNTYFKEGDVVYQLAVRGVLPGDPVC
ncbi:MAG: hypothetical protein QOC57_1083 [Ilumatobacteraceae bacterium]